MLKKSVFSVLCIVLVTQLFCQSKSLEFSYEKGEVLDVIFGVTKPGAIEKVQGYLDKVYPVIKSLGYYAYPIFLPVQNNIKGNFRPDFVAISKWGSLKTRRIGMEQLLKKIPELPVMRKDIWSTFNLTYFEMEKDVNFSISENKVYVVSVYWLKDTSEVNTFSNDINTQITKHGGKVLLEIGNGYSPYEYYYKPDFIHITEWDGEDTFNTYLQNGENMPLSKVIGINQFFVQPTF